MVEMPPCKCLQLKEALEMYLGIPPHNNEDNSYWGNRYFADEIEEQWQHIPGQARSMTIKELCEFAGVPYPNKT